MPSIVMLPCNGRACRCESCGYVASVSDDRPFTSHICHGVSIGLTPPARPVRPGLGDLVKAGLSAVGITEERVSKAIGRPCGCSKRAARLNQLGTYLGLPPGSTAGS